MKNAKNKNSVIGIFILFSILIYLYGNIFVSPNNWLNPAALVVSLMIGGIAAAVFYHMVKRKNN